jgi:hypothetical protein
VEAYAAENANVPGDIPDVPKEAHMASQIHTQDQALVLAYGVVVFRDAFDDLAVPKAQEAFAPRY